MFHVSTMLPHEPNDPQKVGFLEFQSEFIQRDVSQSLLFSLYKTFRGSNFVLGNFAGEFFERFSKNSICPKCKNST